MVDMSLIAKRSTGSMFECVGTASNLLVSNLCRKSTQET